MSKNNTLINLLIVALLVVLILQMCNGRHPMPGSVVIHKDTTWIIKDSTIHSTPKVITQNITLDSTIIREYLPDTNYSMLLAQYNSLLQEYFTSRTYHDSLKIDSIGYVFVKDSLAKNLIVDRTYHYNLAYPHIHDSITVYAPPVRQLYFGAGISGHVGDVTDELSAGFMYKSRKDVFIGLMGTYNNDDKFGLRLQSFWKIKL